jgi:hypothetical protein
MGYLKTHAKKIGLSQKAYNLVYEGLWDLYCKRPQTADLNAKKLDGFVARIKLSVPPQSVTDEEGNVKSSPSALELKAIVRIRIPLKRPVPKVIDEDPDQGNIISSLNLCSEIEVKSGDGSIKKESLPVEVDPEFLDEIELEDKVFCVNPISESCKIWVFH